MWRKVLAIVGLLIFIIGVILLTVEIVVQQAEIERPVATRFIQLLAFRPVIVAGIGILVGPILTIPWWLDRFRQEEKWFEKRDEPLDGPPRVPN